MQNICKRGVMKEVLSTSNMAYCDKMTIANSTPSVVLMQRAGKAIFDNHDWKGKIYIIAGKGNNGGDGFALADIMSDKGIYPYIYMTDKDISSDSSYFYDRLKAKNFENVFDIEKCDYDADIIVDCIFGTGFKGQPKDKYIDIIKNINKSRAYKISADIPSGLDGDNGLYKYCVKADKTISMQFAKSGLYLNYGKDMTGELIVADIGIDLYKEEYKLVERQDISKFFPKRKNNTHKGSYGKSGILGACDNYVGAVKLANMGLCALRSGGGLNVLIIPKSLKNIYQGIVQESTVFAMSDNDGFMVFDKEKIDEALKGVDCLAIGMGIGNHYEANIKIIEYIIKNFEIDILIDADGLNALSINPDILKQSKARIVLTPHVKEMSRLCKTSVDEVLANPIKTAKDFAIEYKVKVLLKGSTTVVTDGREVYLVANGGAELSKGGSGDTLSGVILGLMSQGVGLLQSAYAGAYITAFVAKNLAKEYSEYGVLPSDVAKAVAFYSKKDFE